MAVFPNFADNFAQKYKHLLLVVWASNNSNQINFQMAISSVGCVYYVTAKSITVQSLYNAMFWVHRIEPFYK